MGKSSRLNRSKNSSFAIAAKGKRSNPSSIMEFVASQGRRSNSRARGPQEQKGTEDHIQQIFIVLFPNHVLLIFLGTGFVLIRE